MAIRFDPAKAEDDIDRAMVSYEFGREEPDNPENDMAGGAAYGMAPTLHAAFLQVIEQAVGSVRDA